LFDLFLTQNMCSIEYRTSVRQGRAGRSPAGPIGRKEKTMARTNQLSVRLSLLLVAVVAAFLLIGGAGADAGTPPVPSVERGVRSGATRSARPAEHTAPGGDVRGPIDAIMRTTGMATGSLRPGQVLLIPRG